MLKRPWLVETDPDKADFIIATERWRCADDKPVVLIDEVRALRSRVRLDLRAAPSEDE